MTERPGSGGTPKSSEHNILKVGQKTTFVSTGKYPWSSGDFVLQFQIIIQLLLLYNDFLKIYYPFPLSSSFTMYYHPIYHLLPSTTDRKDPILLSFPL